MMRNCELHTPFACTMSKMNFTPTYSGNYSSWPFMKLLFLFLTVCVTFTHCLPLESSGAAVSKRQTARVMCGPQPRQLCTHTRGTSQYYDHCIEQIFPCGEQGFSLTYAKLRSEAIESMGVIDFDLKKWLHATEACFQEELYSLVNNMSITELPSPQSCLALEIEAITKMNECHRTQTSLCSTLNSANEAQLETLYQNLHTIVNEFRIGGHYYNTVVDLGIPEVVRSCPGHTELADSLTFKRLPFRITMCASGQKIKQNQQPDRDIDPNVYIDTLSSRLLKPAEQFVYSGRDTLGLCDEGRTSMEVYHIITWLAEPDDETALQWNRSTVIVHYRSPEMFVVLFELKEDEDGGVLLRTHSQCGDGIRQAGEKCDYGGNNSLGCDLTCNVKYGYECSVNNLSPSHCVPKTLTPTPSPIICPQAPGRRGRSSRQERLQSTKLVHKPQETIETHHTVSAAMSSRTVTSSLETLVLLALALLALSHCL